MKAKQNIEMTNKLNNDIFIVDDKYKFENVKGFKYLDTIVADKNKIGKEIIHRLTLGNRGCFGLKQQFTSRYLSLQAKIKLYKTLLKPVVTYDSENWVLTKIQGNSLEY